MQQRGLQQYKEQALSMMTQGELLILLLDELVKRLMRSEIALEDGDYEIFEASVQRCISIVRYLDDTLDRRYDISFELHRLYDFFGYDLNRILIGRNMTELQKLKPMIMDLRDSFRSAERKSREGKGGA